MGEFNSKKSFFYRMCKGFYHMPFPRSKWCIYHETYSGPFKKEIDVTYPSWAPDENNNKEVKNFLKKYKIKN